MLLRHLFVLVGCSYSAFAYVLNARNISDSFTTLVNNVPPACTSNCTNLASVGAIDPSNPASVAPFCTDSVETAFYQCTICYQANAPQILTSTIYADLQSAVNSFVAACAAQGSPVTSVEITGPTATGDSGSASQSAAATTPASASTASTASSARTSSTSSRSGALGKTTNMNNIGGVGVLAAVGMVFFA